MLQTKKFQYYKDALLLHFDMLQSSLYMCKAKDIQNRISEKKHICLGWACQITFL